MVTSGQKTNKKKHIQQNSFHTAIVLYNMYDVISAPKWGVCTEPQLRLHAI